MWHKQHLKFHARSGLPDRTTHSKLGYFFKLPAAKKMWYRDNRGVGRTLGYFRNNFTLPWNTGRRKFGRLFTCAVRRFVRKSGNQLRHHQQVVPGTKKLFLPANTTNTYLLTYSLMLHILHITRNTYAQKLACADTYITQGGSKNVGQWQRHQKSCAKSYLRCFYYTDIWFLKNRASFMVFNNI